MPATGLEFGSWEGNLNRLAFDSENAKGFADLIKGISVLEQTFHLFHGKTSCLKIQFLRRFSKKKIPNRSADDEKVSTGLLESTGKTPSQFKQVG